MAPAIDYLDFYGGDPGTLDRNVAQHLLGFAYVVDGASPAADGTIVNVVPWVLHFDGEPPGFDGIAGTEFDVETRNGFAVFSELVSPSASNTEVGWNVYLSGAGDPGDLPNITVGLGESGAVLTDDWITGNPVLSGTPDDGEILWEWTEPTAVDARVPLEYGIHVTTGTPFAAPSNDMLADPEFLSTGLANGVEYHARVQAFLAIGDSGFASDPRSVSNIAAATPSGTPTGLTVHLSGVRAHRT